MSAADGAGGPVSAANGSGDPVGAANDAGQVGGPAAPRRPLAVVTGASSGIGADLARGLAARGLDLWLVARGADAMEAVAKELRDAHRVSVRVRPCDLADPVQRAELGAELAATEVAVLCANAGFPTCGPLAENDPAREAAEIQVNVVALHQLTLAVLPGMLARRRGRILVTGSTAGRQPVPTAATYSATKAFANTFAESLHEELRGTGVTCTLLAPGPVRTRFYEAGGIPRLTEQKILAWLGSRRVAEEALTGLARGRRVVVPGPVAKVQDLAGRHTPRALLFPVLRTTILPRLRRGGNGSAAPASRTPASQKNPE